MENGRIKVWLPAIRAGSGADVYTMRLAQALERQGIASHITWFTKYDELIPLRMMRAAPPPGTDVVLANSWSGYAFKRPRLPLIVTVHHAIFVAALDAYKSLGQRLYHRYIAQPREARSLRVADAVVAVSAYVADHIRGRYGVEDVTVIHNWVDTEKFCPLQQPDRQIRPFRLLYVGKPTLLKGVDLLAPIMRELGSAFELHMTVREDEYRRLNIPSNTRLLGSLSEDALISAYQDCNAVLLPSRSEGFGYAALEAMACGKPVIAANATVLRMWVGDGTAGVACAIDDVPSFVRACRRLAKDGTLRLAMGAAARQRALGFAEATSLGRYVSIIQHVAGVSEETD